jgi:large subunit ribosomal protein L3
MNAIIGKKTAQTQAFLTDGTRIPVTVIDVLENTVLSVKTQEKHGYNAVQLGYGSRKKAIKSLLGHAKKANLQSASLVVREVRVNPDDTLPVVGDLIGPESVFEPGDIVKITGVSKGKGFAGVVKKHHFRGGPRTHGQSDRERAPGSIGQTTTPGRVYRGKRMAGRMGHGKASVLNLEIVSVNISGGKKIVLVKGLVPGSVNSIVTIEKTGKLSGKKFVPLAQVETLDIKEELTENGADEVQPEVKAVDLEAVQPSEAFKPEAVEEEVKADTSAGPAQEKKEETKNG